MPCPSQWHARALSSVADVAPGSWDRLFGNSVFGWHFCRAAEAAPPPGFQLSAIGVFRDATLMAAAPVFETTYRVDQSLPDSVRQAGNLISSLVPQLVNLPMLGLGSPVMDRCPVGLHPDLDQGQRAEVWDVLLAGLDRLGVERGAHLLTIKDLAQADIAWAGRSVADARFKRLASLPVAVLDLPYASEEEYLRSLSGSMRGDLRRKLRQSEHKVRFETRTTLRGAEEEIASLYEATRARRKADLGDFDTLPPSYVGRILEELDGRAQLSLAFVGERLVSFNLFLVEPNRVIAHQIGMQYPLARLHDVYFLNWMRMVRFCLERGITRLEMGQTSYAQKLRLGCRLERSWVYFRHWLRPVNGLMGLMAPMAGFDRAEPGASG